MITVSEKEDCCGCSACAAACPQKCIEMNKDEEGFYYPIVRRELCIGCGKCDSVCPISTMGLARSNRMEILGAQIQSELIRKESTSGGVFTALANEIIRRGGCVFGAGFDDKMHVVHKKAEKPEQLRELRGAKYTQSEMRNAFSLVKTSLLESRPVLFVGTPCQIEGLLHYTGQNPALITVDLACYGVPSPGLYDRYIAFLGEKYASPVKEIYFRDKKYGYSGVNVKVILENGRVLEDNLDVKSYGKSMFSKLGLRPVCYDCPFRVRRKASDITLGDFWEIGQYDSSMDDESGVTKVSLHTEKGKALFNAVSSQLRYTEVKTLEGEALQQRCEQTALHRSCDWIKRQHFFEDMHNMPYPALMEKYLPASYKDKLNNIMKPAIFALLPKSLATWTFRKVKQHKMSGKDK